MESLPMTLLFFVIALGILISIHEFGHFWVARKLGVKVLTFSIGFGKPLWKKTGKVDGTEYVIAAIPLGGYVKMLDEREAPVAEHELARAFNRQSLGARSAIVFAGPLFNFIFAIAAYWLIFVIGETGLKPFVGDIQPQSAAAVAGLQPEDKIVSVDGKTTATWENVVFALLEKSIDHEPVTITVEDPNAYSRDVLVNLDAVDPDDTETSIIEQLGITPFSPSLPPVLGQINAGEPAAQAGLQTNDRILAVNDEAIEDWLEWVKIVRANPQQALSLKVERNGMVMNLSLTPMAVTHGDQTIGRIGAGVAVPEGFLEKYQAVAEFGPLESVWLAGEKTWDFSLLTLKVFGKIITGQASINNLSGPITIAQTAGRTAEMGFITFVKFLAIVSISLGVLNLLPIPVLDGGHLFFYALEAIKGSPLSDTFVETGQKIGMVLLLGLMTVAFYVDINRFFN